MHAQARDNNEKWHTLTDADRLFGYPEGARFYWKPTNIQKSKQLSAPRYIEAVFRWAEDQIQNESIFPTENAYPFPEKFRKRYLRQIFKRLYRLYAILLCNPCLFEKVGIKNVLVSFKFFLYFSWHNQILRKCDEENLVTDVRNIVYSDYQKDLKDKVKNRQTTPKNKNTSMKI